MSPDDFGMAGERVPDDRRPRGRVWLRRLGIAALVIAGLYGAFMVVVSVRWNGRYSIREGVHDRTHGSVCDSNLMHLSVLYRDHVAEHGVPTDGGGAAFVLELAQRRPARYRHFLVRCPCDPDRPPAASAPETSVTAADVSYLARDFGRYPVDPRSKDTEPLIASRPADWQDVRILFADGRVRRIPRPELGYDYGEPIVFGPESRSELLRVLCIEPAEE